MVRNVIAGAGALVSGPGCFPGLGLAAVNGSDGFTDSTYGVNLDLREWRST